MLELQDRIVEYVTKTNSLVSLEKLLVVATAEGFSEGEVLAELSGLKKRLHSIVRQGQVYYSIPVVKPVTIQPHLTWVRDNYPNINLMGTLIPFYSEKEDGPTEVYTLETRLHYKNRNEELKKTYDKEAERIPVANRYLKRTTVTRSILLETK